MIRKIQRSVKRKFVAVTSVASGMIVATCGRAMAAADTETVTAMTTAFTDVKLTGIAALAAIGAVAITLFAGIYAWKYGKKVFTVIAR